MHNGRAITNSRSRTRRIALVVVTIATIHGLLAAVLPYTTTASQRRRVRNALGDRPRREDDDSGAGCCCSFLAAAALLLLRHPALRSGRAAGPRPPLRRRSPPSAVSSSPSRCASSLVRLLSARVSTSKEKKHRRLLNFAICPLCSSSHSLWVHTVVSIASENHF